MCKKLMFISVIIPTYNSKDFLIEALFHNRIKSLNSKDFLIEALNSVMKQSFANIEIIIIDNGSSDGTYQFVTGNYSSLKIIRNDRNMGTSYARNQGIDLAKGKYIILMDCDTVM